MTPVDQSEPQPERETSELDPAIKDYVPSQVLRALLFNCEQNAKDRKIEREGAGDAAAVTVWWRFAQVVHEALDEIERLELQACEEIDHLKFPPPKGR
jgi:hypothetical protein